MAKQPQLGACDDALPRPACGRAWWGAAARGSVLWMQRVCRTVEASSRRTSGRDTRHTYYPTNTNFHITVSVHRRWRTPIAACTARTLPRYDGTSSSGSSSSKWTVREWRAQNAAGRSSPTRPPPDYQPRNYKRPSPLVTRARVAPAGYATAPLELLPECE